MSWAATFPTDEHDIRCVFRADDQCPELKRSRENLGTNLRGRVGLELGLNQVWFCFKFGFEWSGFRVALQRVLVGLLFCSGVGLG